MRLIDTHCHIDSDQYENDLDDVLNRATNAGVERIYLPNVDVANMDSIVALADAYPHLIIPMMGLHPTEIKANYQADLALVREWLVKRPFAAVGEIGVDLYWDKTFVKEQMLAFEAQINMALEFNLPINIHVRDAFNEAFEVLERFRNQALRGVFHCFSGSKEIAERVFRLGDFYLGIGGVLTFKNAKLPDVIKHVGLERIVLETDAPYLSPVPFRGKRNESAYLTHVAQRLGDILEKEADEVGEVTTLNALKIYQRESLKEKR